MDRQIGSLGLYVVRFDLQLEPPLPTSTSFPYTTLFRSRLPLENVERVHVPGEGESPAFLRLDGRLDFHLRRERDRKSTRLNSSHGYISYAVFCLKNKHHFRCASCSTARATSTSLALSFP